jgi:ribosomal protein L16 Arg81 hydroxylase
MHLRQNQTTGCTSVVVGLMHAPPQRLSMASEVCVGVFNPHNSSLSPPFYHHLPNSSHQQQYLSVLTNPPSTEHANLLTTLDTLPSMLATMQDAVCTRALSARHQGILAKYTHEPVFVSRDRSVLLCGMQRSRVSI